MRLKGEGNDTDKIIGFVIGASIVGVALVALVRVLLPLTVFLTVFAFVSSVTAGVVLGARNAWTSYKKRKAADAKKREEEAKKYEAPSLEPSTEASSPIDALTAKAINGSKIAQRLIDQYAALEATAKKNGESVEVLRSKFGQGFKAMDNLLTVYEDVQKNPDAYEDPDAMRRLVLEGEQGLRDKMVDEAKQLTAENVLKAQASAAYLTASK